VRFSLAHGVGQKLLRFEHESVAELDGDDEAFCFQNVEAAFQFLRSTTDSCLYPAGNTGLVSRLPLPARRLKILLDLYWRYAIMFLFGGHDPSTPPY
jgi:hypothetical protein